MNKKSPIIEPLYIKGPFMILQNLVKILSTVVYLTELRLHAITMHWTDRLAIAASVRRQC
ncbi:MAG: hypothetical protein IPO98_04545 [Saprospiraceae bacterium]|nr:hypothetical protein [Saprospiraceae bacterium]